MNIRCLRKKNNNIKSKGRRQEEKGEENKAILVLYEKFISVNNHWLLILQLYAFRYAVAISC
jgi:hypothetical protein